MLRRSVGNTIRDTPEQRIAGRLWRLETDIDWRFPTIEVTVAIGSGRRWWVLILLLAPEDCSDRHVLIHATWKIEGNVFSVVRVLASWWPQIFVVSAVLKVTDALDFTWLLEMYQIYTRINTWTLPLPPELSGVDFPVSQQLPASEGTGEVADDPWFSGCEPAKLFDHFNS